MVLPSSGNRFRDIDNKKGDSKKSPSLVMKKINSPTALMSEKNAKHDYQGWKCLETTH